MFYHPKAAEMVFEKVMAAPDLPAPSCAGNPDMYHDSDDADQCTACRLRGGGDNG